MRWPQKRPPEGGPGNSCAGESGNRNSTISRRCPPFAKQIIQARSSGRLNQFIGTSADGNDPTLWLIAGSDAWSICKSYSESRRLATMLPPGEPPDGFDWTCLAGADPILFMRAGTIEGSTVRDLIQEIIDAGVKRILEIPNGPRYVAGGNHG